jgi:hypothetical protein
MRFLPSFHLADVPVRWVFGDGHECGLLPSLVHGVDLLQWLYAQTSGCRRGIVLHLKLVFGANVHRTFDFLQ